MHGCQIAHPCCFWFLCTSAKSSGGSVCESHAMADHRHGGLAAAGALKLAGQGPNSQQRRRAAKPWQPTSNAMQVAAMPRRALHGMSANLSVLV